MLRPPVLLALLVIAPCAVGCDAAIEPIIVPPGCPTRPMRSLLEYADEPGERMVSDFETGTVALAQVAGRDGSWVKGEDFTSGSLTTEVSGKCPGRDKYSGHFAGSGFKSWGINWTAYFRNNVINGAGNLAAVPYDARAYQGVSFFAALGENNGPDLDVRLGITTMDTNWNAYAKDGVTKMCNPCMDFYATRVQLTRAWSRYVVRFDDMAQAKWGTPQVAMRRDQLVGFMIWPTHQFDIWIDDVRLEPVAP